jgi:hypothetical protein
LGKEDAHFAFESGLKVFTGEKFSALLGVERFGQSTLLSSATRSFCALRDARRTPINNRRREIGDNIE